MARHDDIERELEAQEELESRIRREVVIVDGDTTHHSAEEHYEEEHYEEEHEEKPKRERTWMLFTTGGILTEGTIPYYRYLIAIAVMCFLSIVLTFMSLNADREYRRREKYASVLHERSVLKEELRYSLSSKSAVTERLKRHNIELVDLSKDSRLIAK